MAESVFKDVPLVPQDHVFQVNTGYKQDTDPKKVNLGIGAFRDSEGKPWVLPVVAKVETQLAQGIADKTLNHEYLEIDGLRTFSDAASKFLLGEDSPAIVENRYCGVQAISGTGSCRLAAEFLKRFHPSKTVYVSKPTWGNHIKLLKHTGYDDVREYRYYKKDTRGLDFSGLCEDLEAAPEGSIIVLHACAHNPTGVDPTNEQWEKIASIMKKRKLFPFFDIAYQGFVSGDPELDAWSIRYFVQQGIEIMAAQSFAKCFGLYNERAGNLTVVTVNNDTAEKIRSQMKAIIRPMWSNPPNHGARIVATVLKNPALYQEWKDNLKFMADRINGMRNLLYGKLKEIGIPGTWNHVIEQRGMFSFTGLNPKQVELLVQKYHIYLLNSGRINICGITPSNVNHVAQAIHDAVTSIPSE